MSQAPCSSILPSAIHGGQMRCNGQEKLVAAAFVLIAMSLLIWYRHKGGSSSSRGKLPLPPGPRGLPFLGNLPFLGRKARYLHRCYANYAEAYGPIFKLRLGTKLYIVVSSPSIAKEVYKDHDVVFSNHDQSVATRVISYNGSNLVRCPYGPTWRMLHRVFAQELLSGKSLGASYDLRRREVRRVVHELYSKRGAPVNVGELAFATFLNLLTSMLWGGRLEWEAKGAEFRRVVVETIELLGKPNVSDFFPALARFDLQGVEREIKKRVASLDRIYEGIIDDRVRLGIEGDAEDRRKDLLSALLRIRGGGEPKLGLTDANVKGLIMDIMVGGTGVTSATVEWVMAEIMHKPHIKAKALAELAAVVGGTATPVEESHVPRLHYIRAVIKETLRLHPVVPLLVPRIPSRSRIIGGGYLIPAGAAVVTNVWAIHTDPQVWDSPSEFCPERFLGGGGVNSSEFSFFPFGAGQRRCAGLPLVERVLPLLVATLLHAFEWRIPEGTELDLNERFGVTLTKEKPLLAVPVPRVSNAELYDC